MTGWIWVSLTYATFGIRTDGETIIDAAPIARWTIGKDMEYVLAYYRRKGAKMVVLPND